MPTWVTPKTNWIATDYFNLADGNRIAGNIEYLRDRCAGIFPSNSISLLLYRLTSASNYAMYSELEITLSTLSITQYTRGYTAFSSSEQNNWYTALVLYILWTEFKNHGYVFLYYSADGSNKAAIDSNVGSSSSWVPRYWYEGYGNLIYNNDQTANGYRDYFFRHYWATPSNYPFEMEQYAASGKNFTRQILTNPLQNKPFWTYQDLNTIEYYLNKMHSEIIAKYGE